MAKIYGLFGALTGKLADTVMSVRNGEQIARKYQPIVYNPSTPAQVAQRAKLKLLSQLSAIAAPVIAIPRQGSVSARNLFTKVNFSLTTYSDNAADIALNSVQLTKSVVALPEISANREGSSISVQLVREDSVLSRVVYAIFIKEESNHLRFVSSTVVNEAGVAGNFATTIDVGTSLPVTILAYGVRDNTEAARAYFGNLTVTAEDIARVVTTKQLTEADITLTETRGINVATPAQANESRSQKK